MRKLLLILLCLPFFTFGSFPITSALQISDTIIDGKVSVKTQVDSLSKYPIGDETLTEYKERLKRNGFYQSQNKQPINWKRIIILFFASLLLLFLIFLWSFANSDGWDLGLFNTEV